MEYWVKATRSRSLEQGTGSGTGAGTGSGSGKNTAHRKNTNELNFS